MFGDVSETLDSIRTGIAERLGAHTAFGEPVSRDGVTVIPVAKVALGFGAGAGVGSDRHSTNGDEQSVGGGGGGGGFVQPMGFVEVTDSGARWVPLEPGPMEMALRALTLAAIILPFGGKRGLLARMLLILAGQAAVSRLARPDVSSMPESFRFGRTFSNKSA
jgi:uncharacterized spore protein YtfJ